MAAMAPDVGTIASAIGALDSPAPWLPDKHVLTVACGTGAKMQNRSTPFRVAYGPGEI